LLTHNNVIYLVIQAHVLNKYCEMLDFNFLVTDFDILFKLLNYITLHYIILHYITLHYITSIYISRFNVCLKTVDMKQDTNIQKTTHTGFIKRHINICKNVK